MSAQTTVTAEEPRVLEAPPTVPEKKRRFRPTKTQLAGLAGLAAVAALPIPFGSFGFFIGQYALVYSIIGLSVIVVTGYAGLISLMPYAFAGIGAVATGAAMASWGWPFWLALVVAALATVPVALVVGVASVRLKGLYLAIATLTVANALGDTFFKWDRATGGDEGWLVTRPVLGPFDLASDVTFYVVLLVVALLLVWMIEGLRTSRMGRAMLAVRDNEREAQALGINVYKTKLAAFVIGGMLAGVGGAFLALLLLSVTPQSFQSPLVETTSILLIIWVVIGGIDRAIGAFLGAVALVVQQQVFAGAEFFFAFFGIYAALLLIGFLLFRPGGIVQVGKILGELTRARPLVGISVGAAIILTNVGLAALILKLS
jgi:branched-chain amino acid transport system permease protein